MVAAAVRLIVPVLRDLNLRRHSGLHNLLFETRPNSTCSAGPVVVSDNLAASYNRRRHRDFRSFCINLVQVITFLVVKLLQFLIRLVDNLFLDVVKIAHLARLVVGAVPLRSRVDCHYRWRFALIRSLPIPFFGYR